MPETQFIETEALLLALRDAEANSGAFELDEYLDREFLEGELRKLADAAEVLAGCAWKAYQRKRANRGPGRDDA